MRRIAVMMMALVLVVMARGLCMVPTFSSVEHAASHAFHHCPTCPPANNAQDAASHSSSCVDHCLVQAATLSPGVTLITETDRTGDSTITMHHVWQDDLHRTERFSFLLFPPGTVPHGIVMHL